MGLARDGRVARCGGGRLRNLLGSIAVLAVAGAIAVGLPAVDREVPSVRPLPVGRPYEIGGGIRLIPPRGALLDVTKTRPLADRGTVLFLIGPVRYAVVAAPFSGSLSAATDRLRGKISTTGGYRVTGPETQVTIGASLTGLGGGYAAAGRVGRYMVFLMRGMAIEVTVSGSQADVRRVLGDIEASLGTLSYRADR